MCRHCFSSKEQESFNFMAAVTICSDFGAQENKVCRSFHCFPNYLSWSDGTGCCDLSFFDCWVLSQLFHSPLSLSSRGSSVPLRSATRVVSSAYLKLLIFLPAILIPAYASSSPEFLMMYCRSPLMARTWHLRGNDKKVKERKRLILPGLCRKPIKSLTQDLRLSRRHRVPSLRGWRHRAPSRESLRSPGRRVSKTGLCAPRNQPRRVRERERKKERHRTQALMEQRCFNDFSVSLYRL